MRIIAGRHRGRTLAAPEGKQVRPTSGRMRERVFSMLQNRRYPPLDGARVADIFAGTGALGLEAISRGAAFVTFVEKSPSSLACLQKNITAFQADTISRIVKCRASELPKASGPCSHIFMDAPYGRDLTRPALDCLLAGGWVGTDTVIVCELQTGEALELPDQLQLVDERTQGIQRVVFLRLAQQ